MNFIRRFTTITLLFLVSGSLLAESAPREILSRARALESPESAVRLLESEIPPTGTWRFYYLMEIAYQHSLLNDWALARKAVIAIDAASIPADRTDQYTYWNALTIEKNGDSAAAEQLYKKRIFSGAARDPQLYLGYLRLASSDAEKTVKLMDSAIPDLRKLDRDSWLLSRYLAGLVAVREGSWAFASDSFSIILHEKDSADPEYLGWASFYHGWSLYRLGRWEPAFTSLVAFLGSYERHERVWQASTAAAFCAMQTGRDPLPYADRAITHAPTQNDRAETLILKASILIDRGEFAPAEKILVSVADGISTSGQTVFSPRARFMLADTAFTRRDYPTAEKHWLILYDQFPKNALAEESLFRAAEQWYLQGKHSRAVELFNRYRQNHPNGTYMDLVLKNGGEVLASSGQRELAILWWESFISRFPKSPFLPRVQNDLVAAYRETKDYTAALRLARAYQREFPREAETDDIGAQIQTLQILERGETPDTAKLMVEYKRLGGEKTESGRARGLELAKVYLADTSRRDEGHRILEDISKTLPRSTAKISRSDRTVYATSYMLLANIFRGSDDLSNASSAFLSAGTLFSPIDGERAAESLYGAVDAFMRTGRNSDAVQALKTMRTSWPDSVWTRRASRLVPAE